MDKAVAKQRSDVPTKESAVYMPYVDIYETKDELVLLADMPGVCEKDVNVDLEKGVLTIRGHAEPEKHDGFQPLQSEYGVGDYERRFTLSNEIDATRIGASIKDGVLKVVLPKAEEVKARKIPVSAG